MQRYQAAILTVMLIMMLALTAQRTVIAQDDAPTMFGYGKMIEIGRGAVYSEVWRPDGRALAAVGSNGVWLYDDHLQDIQHIDAIASAAVWHPNGNFLALSVAGKGVALYDVRLKPAQLVRWLTDSEHDRSPLAWSLDGNVLASFAYLGIDAAPSSVIHLYDAEHGNLIRSLALPPRTEAESIVWQADGRHLAASVANQLLIWDVTNGDIESAWTFDATVRSPVWSPDGTQLMVLGAGGTLYLLDRDDGTRQPIALPSTDFLVAARWSVKDGITLIGKNGGITHAESDRPQQFALPVPIYSAAISADGTQLATFGEDYVLAIHDLVTHTVVATDESFSERLNVATWSQDGTRIVAGYSEGEGRVWDAVTGKLLARFPQNGFDAAWSPDGHTLATTTPWYDKTVEHQTLDIRDVLTWQIVRSIPSKLLHMAWSSDSRLIAGYDPYDSKINVIEVTTGSVVQSITVNNRGLGALTWSPDGRFLAGALVLGIEAPMEAVAVWDVSSGERRYLVSANAPASWSKDGTRLATLSGSFLSIRDAETGLPMTVIQTRPFAEEWTQNASLAWSADGTRLAISQQDTLIVDPRDGKLLGRVPSAVTGIGLEALGYGHRIDWTHDGKRLLTANPRGVITVWEAEANGAATMQLPIQEQVTEAMTAPDSNATTPTLTPPMPAPATSALQLTPWEFKGGVRVSVKGNDWSAWSPHGTYLLISGSVGDEVKSVHGAGVFEMGTGEMILRLHSALSGSWSVDEQRVAIMLDNGDGTVTLETWSVSARRLLWSVRGSVRDENGLRNQKPPVPSVTAFSPDGTQLAERRLDGSVVLYEASSGKIIAQFQAVNPLRQVGLMQWNVTGDRLLVSVAGNGLQLWNVTQTPALIATLYNTTGGVGWSHDGTLIAVGTDVTHVFVYDAQSGRFLYALDGQRERMTALGWSPDDRYLFSYALWPDGPVPTGIVWDMSSRQIAATVQGADYVTDVNWTRSHGVNRLMVAAIFRNIAVWSADSNQTIDVELTEGGGDANIFVPATLSPDGRFVALIVDHGQAYNLEIRDAGTGKPLAQTTLPPIADKYIWGALVWSPDGRYVYATSEFEVAVYQVGNR